MPKCRSWCVWKNRWMVCLLNSCCEAGDATNYAWLPVFWRDTVNVWSYVHRFQPDPIKPWNNFFPQKMWKECKTKKQPEKKSKSKSKKMQKKCQKKAKKKQKQRQKEHIRSKTSNLNLNVLYTICYILYSILYLISVFQYYIRISDISNLILRISHPASDFMFCLLIIIMIVYLFCRHCNYN